MAARAGRVVSVWSPPVVSAIVTAIGVVLAAWVTGALKQPDTSGLETATKQLTTEVQALRRWQERHDDKHDAIDKRDEDRRREVDLRIDQQRSDLNLVADRTYRRRRQ